MFIKIRDCCPDCGSVKIKKNGHIHNGKQNYRCKECRRSFVANPENILISQEKRELIKKLLLERVSLRGICRSVGVSLRWLLGFIVEVYKESPDSLNISIKFSGKNVEIHILESEVDELWRLFGNSRGHQV